MEKIKIGYASQMKDVSDQLAAKIVDAVLEERCVSDEGMRLYRPLLEERAQRIVARLATSPDGDSGSNDDPLDGIHTLFSLADTIVKNELSSNRYPKPACPDDGGCIACCTHMRIVLSVQEAAVIARALLELTESPEFWLARCALARAVANGPETINWLCQCKERDRSAHPCLTPSRYALLGQPSAVLVVPDKIVEPVGSHPRCHHQKCKTPHSGAFCVPGGESGIRTHGRLTPTAVFKTAALNHSAISP